VKSFDELPDGSFIALDMRVHPAVGAIAYPASDSKRLGLFTHPCAKEHALHSPGHANVPSDFGHHTVAMSGASSAFIPTTL
jgi:hypothetical protein